MQDKRKSNAAGLGVVVVILVICLLATSIVLCNRIISYTEAKFVNILSLTEETANGGSSLPPVATAPVDQATTSREESGDANQTASGSSDPDENIYTGDKHPEFRMEAEAEIFRFSYDNESGKSTVIAAATAGDPDKLIAPGTTNLYQFTLSNPGDVSLDYILTMEAYVTGTDLWIPVNARVWDYTNKYLVGTEEGMVDVMELNTVEEHGELGAGRYAVYNLEWEWPFERPDENGDIASNDVYDTMLGDLAVDEDLVLTIVIHTVAEYDDDPDDPNAGQPKPPQTGDDAPLLLLSLLCGGSFVGLCVMFLAFFKSERKEKKAE